LPAALALEELAQLEELAGVPRAAGVSSPAAAIAPTDRLGQPATVGPMPAIAELDQRKQVDLGIAHLLQPCVVRDFATRLGLDALASTAGVCSGSGAP
jgi:hypothetical protein